MKTSDFDYPLPEALIARFPLPERGDSRLLHVDGPAGGFRDRAFRDLPGLFRAGDLLLVNDTRVIKARLQGVKETGGRVEVLVERVLSDREALVFMRFSHPPAPGMGLTLASAVKATVRERRGELFRLEFDPARTVLEWLEAYGEVPLPPYLDRPAEAEDETRYQTVYAQRPGAVAAPTAGLHFDQAMFVALAARGVETARLTLHVGAGTWQPVRGEDLSEHRMHRECYEIPAEIVAAVARTRARGGRVCAVGTTTLRALESAAREGGLAAGTGETDLFITPGYRFRVVDRLITNFHLPRSTLFMLVCAFGGTALMRRAYAHAVEARYRFFSYGDAMLIERADGEEGDRRT